MKKTVSKFYQQLYTKEISGPCNAQDWRFSQLLREEQRILYKYFSTHEVKSAMFGMGPLKAPGADGFIPRFYQTFWGIMRDSVVNFVCHVFARGTFEKSWNCSLISLIPKINAHETVSQFCHIAICNVLVKTVTKVTTNRLKIVMSKLTSQDQCSFIPRRHGSNNVVIAQG